MRSSIEILGHSIAEIAQSPLRPSSTAYLQGNQNHLAADGVFGEDELLRRMPLLPQAIRDAKWAAVDACLADLTDSRRGPATPGHSPIGDEPARIRE
jgi:hypothetical protein